MRFLHTADWQLGMLAAHAGSAATRVREERLRSVERVLTAAHDAGAEFMLVAGDVFEHNGVERTLVQRTAEMLRGSAIPVYLLPGNHDPLEPGSVWEHPAWARTHTVQVLRKEDPLEIPGGILFPCPARFRNATEDPTVRIPSERASNTIRIGIAHGTVEGVRQDEPDYPIARDAAQRCKLDYLALGHWHSTTLYRDASGAVRMAYPGTPEPSRFGERDSGNALLVEITHPEAVPMVTAVRTGALTWVVMEETLRAAEDAALVLSRLETLPDPARTLLRLRLDGVLFARAQGSLEHLGQVVATRFLYGRTEVFLRPAPEDDGWFSELPPGALREAALQLRALASPDYEGIRPEGATPEVASLALLELFDLAAQHADATK